MITIGIYTNNRYGTEYLVRGVVTDCSNDRDGTICVLYHRYDDFPNTAYYVRELEEFKEKFTFNRKY